jgi:hypothetical protein
MDSVHVTSQQYGSFSQTQASHAQPPQPAGSLWNPQ